MLSIKPILNSLWCSVGTTHVRGYAFLNEKLFQGTELASLLSSNPENLIPFLNGCFAVIHIDTIQSIIAVDKARSIPLFYSLQQKELLIYDASTAPTLDFNNENIREEALLELSHLNIVTGNKTIYSNIHQLQAAEMLIIKDTIYNSRYYQYICDEKNQYTGTTASLMESWDNTLVKVFERQLKLIGNKPIILSLSGGVNSKLIAFMCKRLGYNNVFCFCYGFHGITDFYIKYSKRIAQDLGYPWQFIQCTPERWQQWYHSDDWQQFLSTTSSIGNIINAKDWPGLFHLHINQYIPNDGIIFPGWGMGNLAGKMLPLQYIEDDTWTKKDIVAHIWQEHDYSNIPNQKQQQIYPWKQPLDSLYQQALYNIYNNILPEDSYSQDTATKAFEHWTWQEMTTKHLLSATQLYDYKKFNWALPFWDNDILSFWQKVPLKYRIESYMHRYHITRLEKEILGYELAPPWTFKHLKHKKQFTPG